MARHAARTQQEQYPSSYFAAHEILVLLEDMGYKDDYPGSDEEPNPFDG